MLSERAHFQMEELHGVSLNSIIQRSALCSHRLGCFAELPNVSSPMEPPSDSHRFIQTCKAGDLLRDQFWSREACKKRRVPGPFHQRRPLPPLGPFPLFFFFLNLSLFLFVLPASPSAPSSSTNERPNLSYALSGLLFFPFFSPLCGRRSGREPVCFPLLLLCRGDRHKGSWDLEHSAPVEHVAPITRRYQKTSQTGGRCGFQMSRWLVA